MSLGRRVQDRVALAPSVPAATVTRAPGHDGAGTVEVIHEAGRHGDRDWRVLLSVRFEGETVSPGSASLMASRDGGSFVHVCDIKDAAGHPVPPSVLAASRRIRDAVHGADLQELPLSPRARGLLDGLRDIALAQAKEDEAALAEAMEAGRELVLTYRPSLANALPPASRGPGPR